MRLVNVPKNFGGQAIAGLSELAEHLRRARPFPGAASDADAIDILCSLIENAQHFTLPKNAKILGDNLDQLVDEELHLPFPSIALEYEADPPDEYTEDVCVHSPKRVVLASEMTVQEIRQLMLKIYGQEPHIFPAETDPTSSKILIFYAMMAYDEWKPGFMGWALDTKDFFSNPARVSRNMIPPLLPDNGKRKKEIGGNSVVLLPGTFQLVMDKVGYQKALQMGVHDTSGEIGAVLELIEALLCRNVTYDFIQDVTPALVERRKKTGKSRLFNVRTIRVDAPQPKAKESGGTASDRASPTEHLRRGHVRRVGKAKVRMWFPPVIVNPGSKGAAASSSQIRYIIKKKGSPET